jgi:hypothetical protein
MTDQPVTLPPEPGAAFTRMKDRFERDTGPKTDGAKGKPEPDGDLVLLAGAAALVRTAAACAGEHATDYTNRTKGQQDSTAPATFMNTLSMVLQTAADVLDEMVSMNGPDGQA